VLPWSADPIQWLEILLASASWLLSLHLSRHIAAVNFTHLLSFDAPLGPPPVAFVNTGRITPPSAALIAHHYLPNLTLGLDSTNPLIRYYAYQNLSHAAQYSAERRQLMYGAAAFDSRGAEGIWRGVFLRCCTPLEALLKPLRSAAERPADLVLALEHLQVQLWSLKAISWLIKCSKSEDQYGIVQSTNAIQAALVLLLELHGAVEDVVQLATRSFEGGYYERPPLLALHSGINLSIYEITTTFFESMSYFKFPEHLISRLYTFLQFNE
jgi:hypothetical protein